MAWNAHTESIMKNRERSWNLSILNTKVIPCRNAVIYTCMYNMYNRPTTWDYKGPSWPSSCGSWIYNYLCNRCLSPLMLWVLILFRARCITLCDKVCQWLAAGWWFSPGSPVSSTNKTDRHDITEILLNVALFKTINH
jgi:hypothetical protein